HQLLVVAAPHVVTSLRVTLARRRELDVVSLPCRVFRPVVGVTTIHEELTTRRQTEWQHAESTHVRGRARKESQLDGHALFSRHDLHTDSVEVATFTGNVAAKLFVTDHSTTANPHVVADRDGKRVEQILGRDARLLQ